MPAKNDRACTSSNRIEVTDRPLLHLYQFVFCGIGSLNS
uniref:Uncharacterized protein n=1 Tax=Anguilla anguilla TaxID=7936 RepID=A0A0E9W1P5_ANGAN